MKNYIFITVVFIMIITGCDNNNCTGNSDDEYHFTAKVDQERWEGDCYLDFANQDKQNLFLVPDNQESYIIIKIAFDGVGEYTVIDSSVILFETIGGDVLVGKYYSDANLDNKLIIENYDETKGVIEGSFNFKIRKQSSIIDIKSGMFKANFINVN